MDRRAFLRTAIGATGALVVASCKKSGTPAFSPSTVLGPVDATELPAIPRATIRMAGGDFGLPSPFSYLVGPGYGRMILVYDTLLQYNAQRQLVPWLASSYTPSPDGLVHTLQWAYRQAGISLPRTTAEQIRVGIAVDPAELRPGDLVFSRGGRPVRDYGHVGIYAGDNKIIIAPHSGEVVSLRTLRPDTVQAVRRVLLDPTSPEPR